MWALMRFLERKEEAQFMMQRFQSISCFFEDFGIPYTRKASQWRLTPRLLGQIQAIPQSRGILTATNGIDCYIVRGDQTLFKGHIGWFVPDEIEGLDELLEDSTPRLQVKRETQRKKDIFEFCVWTPYNNNNNKTMPEQTCKICKVVCKNAHQLTLHRRQNHPETNRVRKPKDDVNSPLNVANSPLQRIYEHQQGIQKELRNLEAGRDSLHDKIIQIDTLIAKYKQFQEG